MNLIAIYGFTLPQNKYLRNRFLYSCFILYFTYKSSGYLDEYMKKILHQIYYVDKKKAIYSGLFNLTMRIPYFKAKLLKEIAPVEQEIISNSLKQESSVKNRNLMLENKRTDVSSIIEQMRENVETDNKLYNPLKLSGTLYNTPSKEELSLLKGVIDIYYKTNPLHADIYPSLITMEKDIISITKNILNCPKESGYGTLTTGGTESIMLALFGYREYAFKKRNITNPEVLALKTVHPAFDKGCKYLGIKLVKVSVDNKNSIDYSEFTMCVNHNTILIVGSVPSFPHGLIDNIQLINTVAGNWNIPIHIDACLGGFVAPFLNGIPPFDFRVKGVQSISVDTHKYGCCPKGSSVLVFRDREYLESCYFIQSEWMGGIYATTNMTGSRSGLNIAWTWAMLKYLGYQGLNINAAKIVFNLEKIKRTFQNNSNIFIYGNPRICVIGFGSFTLNIYEISSEMKSKGWNLNELQNPPSFHLCITNCHTEKIIDEFIKDLRESIEIATRALTSGESRISKQSASIYGTTQRVPDQSVVDNVVKIYLNSLH